MLAALLWAGSSQAKVVTVGATLPMQIQSGFVLGCNSCVLANMGSANGASDVSPVDGLIIRWHLFSAGSSTPRRGFRLRVLSPQGQQFVGAGRSAAAGPAEWSAVEGFPADLPIRAGQLIGLELEDQGSNIQWGLSPGAAPVLLEPSIADGEAAAPPPWWGERGGWIREAVWPFNAEILPAPEIAGVSPAQGPPAGGSQVAITGEDFARVTSVSFGSTEASYVVNSESQLTATVPAGPAGSSVPVSVVTAAGRAEAPADYVYEPSQTRTGPTPVGCNVPRLKDRRLKGARRMLSRHGCQLGPVKRRHHATVRSGRVKRQSPPPGTALPSGGRVEVTLGLPR